MKCLRKFVWIKIPRAEIPHNSKGMMLYFLRLASRAAFRKGTAVEVGEDQGLAVLPEVCILLFSAQAPRLLWLRDLQ